MSRSGYSDDVDGAELNLWRGAVERAIKGKRGQAFLRELAEAMDAMPVKRLIAEELIDSVGEVCAIGAVCKARVLDVSKVYIEDPSEVGRAVGIAPALAAEIEYVNDDDLAWSNETPEQRWYRVRRWVAAQIKVLERKYERRRTGISRARL